MLVAVVDIAAMEVVEAASVEIDARGAEIEIEKRDSKAVLMIVLVCIKVVLWMLGVYVLVCKWISHSSNS